MNHRTTGPLLTGLLLVGALALTACGAGSDPDGGAGLGSPGTAPTGAAVGTMAAGDATRPTPLPGAMTVVAAENLWGDIASQVGGRHVAVTSIISDPNADPHQYETDPKDAAAISRASIVIENGLGYDDFIDKLLGTGGNRHREVLSVARTVGANGRNANPHLWYSPAYVATAATAFAARFAQRDPADADTFQANLNTFLAGERQVTAVIDQIRARYQGDPIAYTERVPGYLVQAAGLKLATPASFSQSVEDGDEPGPRDTATFDAALHEKKVKVLLYNGQVTSPVTQRARTLATAAGIPVIGVTETLPPTERNFQTWQADQARAILAALGG